MSRSRIVVGMEIGTSKICTVVGEQRDDGALAIIGIGECPARGVRKAEVVDLETAVQCVHQSVAAAEDSAGVEIRSLYAGVSGSHIRSFNNRGIVPVQGEGGEISDSDVESAVRNARAINVPPENAVLHSLCQHYYVDGQDGVLNPLGMLGARLSADVHVIHGGRNRTQNLIKCIRSVPPLEVNEVVFNGFAAALAVLSDEQRQQGALVIDMGGGTTDFVVYVGGAIKHSGVIAVGGDHISNDVSLGLKIPCSRAERLKVEHGTVALDDSMKGKAISLTGEISIGSNVIFKDHLCQVMQLRAEETLQLVKRELDKSGFGELLGAGVFLVGGCAHVRGIKDLAADVFGLPVQIGSSQTVMGLTAALDRPEYAAPIGITRFGAIQMGPPKKRESAGNVIGRAIYGLISKMRMF
ncbi:MAG: cell division protein FtsA [Verrucomicrobia bacterium]|nr:cell division protein FtsA [Verrucomicrobiota bacterium]